LILNITSLEKGVDLLPQHGNGSLYIPDLKPVMTMGHFIIFHTKNSPGSKEKKVERLLQKNKSNESNVTMFIFLPHYHKKHCSILLSGSQWAIQHMSCVRKVELVKMGRVANVSVNDVACLVFIFLILVLLITLIPFKACRMHTSSNAKCCEWFS
jgi:hypothetical protein